MLELEGLQGAVAGVELSGGCWDIQMILGLRGLRDNSPWGQWYWEMLRCRTRTCWCDWGRSIVLWGLKILG